MKKLLWINWFFNYFLYFTDLLDNFQKSCYLFFIKNYKSVLKYYSYDIWRLPIPSFHWGCKLGQRLVLQPPSPPTDRCFGVNGDQPWCSKYQTLLFLELKVPHGNHCRIFEDHFKAHWQSDEGFLNGLLMLWKNRTKLVWFFVILLNHS